MSRPAGKSDRRAPPMPAGVELVHLPARRRLAPAVAVVILSIGLIGVASWKPWASTDRAAGISTAAPGSAAATRPGSTASPGAASAAASSGGPVFLGLDLGRMGDRVRRDGWGVAVASVPVAAIGPTGSGPGGSITPDVAWSTISPGSRAPGPTLVGAGHATVAIAVTWPRGVVARRVRLDYLGPVAGSAATFGPRERRTVPLSAALPALLAPVPADWRASAGYVPPRLERSSGTFFLSPAAVVDAQIDWSVNGWAGGAYAFRIEASDGTIVRLPFRLGG
jgi:hypothetical protein